VKASAEVLDQFSRVDHDPLEFPHTSDQDGEQRCLNAEARALVKEAAQGEEIAGRRSPTGRAICYGGSILGQLLVCTSP
jgi:hypothetical protein